MNHVVNFSGGRTSAKLVLLIEEMRAQGKITGNVEYVFADTGAEHPKTYEFIRQFVAYSGVNLTCLRAVISKELGVGVSYRVVSLDSIGYDLTTWREILAAYSSPFNPGGAFCTDMLKSIPSDKYCNHKYGRGNYYKWIGYRADESKRAWGAKVYSKLLKSGMTEEDTRDLMSACMMCAESQMVLDAAFSLLDDAALAEAAAKRVSKLKAAGFRFMFEIDDSEKQDVLDFWKQMPFDLQIPEHLGNCVFCIKKGDNKIELAARLEPQMAAEWGDIFHENTVRDLNRGFPPQIIYRGKLSMEAIRLFYQNVDTRHIEARMRHAKVDGVADSCSDSCSAFGKEIEEL